VKTSLKEEFTPVVMGGNTLDRSARLVRAEGEIRGGQRQHNPIKPGSNPGRPFERRKKMKIIMFLILLVGILDGFYVGLDPGDVFIFNVPEIMWTGKIKLLNRTSLCYVSEEWWNGSDWIPYGDTLIIPMGSVVEETYLMPRLFCSVAWNGMEVSSHIKEMGWAGTVYIPMVRHLRRH